MAGCAQALQNSGPKSQEHSQVHKVHGPPQRWGGEGGETTGDGGVMGRVSDDGWAENSEHFIIQLFEESNGFG